MDKIQHIARLIKTASKDYSEHNFVFMIPEVLSKKFIGYCSMKEDLELILNYIKILRTDPDSVIKSALTYSTISLYGKCYTDASKNKFPKLETKNFVENNDDLFETHQFLMDLRHQFIAHRGDTTSEVGFSYLLMSKENYENKNEVRFSAIKRNSFSKTDLDKSEDLIIATINYLKEIIQKKGEKLLNDYLEKFTAEQIAMFNINNHT